MQKESKELSTDDFITLSSIKKVILDLLRLVFNFFDFLLKALKTFFLWFLLCCFLGIGISYLIYKLKPKYYESEMIVYNNELSKKDYNEIIKNLNNLLITRSYNDLSALLKLNPDKLNKIENFQAVSIINENLDKDTSTKVGQPFKIIIKFKDETNVDSLQSSIIEYLNSNPYLSKIREGQTKILTDKLDFINNQLQKLDSAQRIYNRVMLNSKMPATFYNNAMNPADLYNQSINLANEKETILKWLNNKSQAVMLIDGLKKPVYSDRISLKIWLIIGALFGAILGMIVAALMLIRKTYQ